MANRVLPAVPLLLASVLGSCLTEAGPCTDYCDYICACHEGEAGFDCDECRTVYSDADPELQDECETELTTVQQADEANGTGCDAGEDTAAG